MGGGGGRRDREKEEREAGKTMKRKGKRKRIRRCAYPWFGFLDTVDMNASKFIVLLLGSCREQFVERIA